MSASIYGNVGGTARKTSKLYGNVGGANRKLKSLWANVNGVNRKIFSGAVTWTHQGNKSTGIQFYVSTGSFLAKVGTAASGADFYAAYRYIFDEPLTVKSGDTIALATSLTVNDAQFLPKSALYINSNDLYIHDDSYLLLCYDGSSLFAANSHANRSHTFTSNATINNVIVRAELNSTFVGGYIEVLETATLTADGKTFVLNDSGTSENQ